MNLYSQLSRVQNYLEQRSDRVLWIIGTLALIFCLFVRVIQLDRGFIFSDDAWYLALIKFNPSEYMPVRFFKLFQFGWHDNLYALRTLSLALQLCAHIYFAYGVYKYMRHYKENVSLYVSLCVVALGSLSIPEILTPNYINLNLVYGQIVAASLLLWLAERRWSFALLSSFGAALLFTSQFTCLILLPFVYAIILYLSQNKVKDTVYCIAGVLLFAIPYFTFVETPSEIIASVTAVSKKTIAKGSSEYGWLYLMKWTLSAFFYLLKVLIAAVALKHVYIQTRQHSTLRKYSAFIFLVATALVLAYITLFVKDTWEKGKQAQDITTFGRQWIWLMIFLFGMLRRKYFTKERWIAIGILCFIPFALSLGTNIPFWSRQTNYLVFLAPVVYFMMAPTAKMKLFANLCMCTMFFCYISWEFYAGNWAGNRIIDQTEDVRQLGINQNLKISPRYIDKLKFCKETIPEGAACYFHDPTWGIGALLDYQPLSLKFKIPSDSDVFYQQLEENLTKHKDVYIVIYKQSYVFPENFFGEDMSVTVAKGEDLNIYRIARDS